MTIEFNVIPEVEETLINTIKEKLVNLTHIKKDISRAEVYMRIDEEERINNKVCEIRLTFVNDELFTHHSAANFSKAASEALEAISKMVKTRKKEEKEPPDQLLSTVKV